jgi:hypothetical protein
VLMRSTATAAVAGATSIPAQQQRQHKCRAKQTLVLGPRSVYLLPAQAASAALAAIVAVTSSRRMAYGRAKNMMVCLSCILPELPMQHSNSSSSSTMTTQQRNVHPNLQGYTRAAPRTHKHLAWLCATAMLQEPCTYCG